MNKVKCLECGKEMESYTVHDFKACGCPNETFVDGGTVYQRCGGRDLSMVAVWKDEWVPLSEIDRGRA